MSIQGLERSVGRVEGMLKQFIETHDKNRLEDLKRYDDLERRTRKLEGRQKWNSGASAVIGAVFAFVTHKISSGG